MSEKNELEELREKLKQVRADLAKLGSIGLGMADRDLKMIGMHRELMLRVDVTWAAVLAVIATHPDGDALRDAFRPMWVAISAQLPATTTLASLSEQMPVAARQLDILGGVLGEKLLP